MTRKPWQFLPSYSKEQRLDDHACLLFFLIGALRKGHMFNGRRATDAFDAACRLLDQDPDEMRKTLLSYDPGEVE